MQSSKLYSEKVATPWGHSSHDSFRSQAHRPKGHTTLPVATHNPTSRHTQRQKKKMVLAPRSLLLALPPSDQLHDKMNGRKQKRDL